MTKTASSAKRRTKSMAAGLTMPVARVGNKLRKLTQIGRLSENAAVFMTGVLEYMAAEVMELSGNVATGMKKTRITPRHVLLAIKDDSELSMFSKNVVIAGGGVIPKIVEFKKDAEKKKEKKSEEKEKVSVGPSVGLSKAHSPEVLKKADEVKALKTTLADPKKPAPKKAEPVKARPGKGPLKDVKMATAGRLDKIPSKTVVRVQHEEEAEKGENAQEETSVQEEVVSQSAQPAGNTSQMYEVSSFAKIEAVKKVTEIHAQEKDPKEDESSESEGESESSSEDSASESESESDSDEELEEPRTRKSNPPAKKAAPAKRDHESDVDLSDEEGVDDRKPAKKAASSASPTKKSKEAPKPKADKYDPESLAGIAEFDD